MPAVVARLIPIYLLRYNNNVILPLFFFLSFFLFQTINAVGTATATTMEIVGPHISRVDSIVNNLATVKANSDGLVSAVNKKILDAEEKTDVRVKLNQPNKHTNDQATQTKTTTQRRNHDGCAGINLATTIP